MNLTHLFSYLFRVTLLPDDRRVFSETCRLLPFTSSSSTSSSSTSSTSSPSPKDAELDKLFVIPVQKCDLSSRSLKVRKYM